MALERTSKPAFKEEFLERNKVIAEVKECITSKNLERGKNIHETTIHSGLDVNVYVASTLINMYAKFGCMNDAYKVFQNAKHPNAVCWNALILGYAVNGEGELALDLLAQMRQEGCTPTSRTFIAALKACAGIAGKVGEIACRRRGMKLHLLALRNGFGADVYVQATLVQMYAICGSTEAARGVLDSNEHPSILCWNASIFGYAENGQGELALALFLQMGRGRYQPNAKTFLAVFKACTGLGANDELIIERGNALHMLAWSTGLESAAYIENSLVGMYAKCGRMEDAHSVFDGIKHPDVVSWTALALGYANKGEGETCLHLFCQMRRDGGCEPNERSFVAALKACSDLAIEAEEDGREGCLRRGKRLHLLAVGLGYDSDIYVQSILVDMYSKCGSMADACVVFNSIKNPDVVVWTAFILGYADNGESEIALDIFLRMHHEGVKLVARIVVAALKACADFGVRETSKLLSKRRAKELHLLSSMTGCDLDIFVQGTLIDMYAKVGNTRDALNVFKRVEHPNVVCWNALISGYVENGESDIALTVFLRMASTGCEPDERTFVAVLKACTDLAENEERIVKVVWREKGNALLMLACQSGRDSDSYLKNTLVDFFAKCGSMVDAKNIFDRIENRNVVSWTALILGYADNLEAGKALEYFAVMKREGCVPNPRTFVAALKACSMLGAIESGKAFHCEITSHALEHDVLLRNNLVDFYVKCGCLVEAKQVFYLYDTRDLGAWNALMVGYGRNGDTKGVFQLFNELLDSGLHPDTITFNCILNVCSHAGLVDKGRDYFEAMSAKYGINPDVEHYNCIIDMFGRANKLDEAMLMVRNIPFSSIAVAWKTILGACRKWKNVQLGRLAFEALVSLKDGESGGYIAMANIYGTKI